MQNEATDPGHCVTSYCYLAEDTLLITNTTKMLSRTLKFKLQTGKKEKKNTYDILLQPRCLSILVHDLHLQGLAFYDAGQRFPDIEELPIMQIFRRGLFGLTDTCKLER